MIHKTVAYIQFYTRHRHELHLAATSQRSSRLFPDTGRLENCMGKQRLGPVEKLRMDFRFRIFIRPLFSF